MHIALIYSAVNDTSPCLREHISKEDAILRSTPAKGTGCQFQSCFPNPPICPIHFAGQMVSETLPVAIL